MRMIVFVLLLSRLAPAADWRMGQLVDVSSERVFAGTADDPGSVFEGRRAQYVTVRSYVIRAGDREYTLVARPSPGLLRPHIPHVVVNTTIRFQVEKGKVAILDDDGREFKGRVEREVLLKQ